MPKWEWCKDMEGEAMCVTNTAPDGTVLHYTTYMSNDGEFLDNPGDHLMWDGDLEKPTLTRSILHQQYVGREQGYVDYWHGYLRKGEFVEEA